MKRPETDTKAKSLRKWRSHDRANASIMQVFRSSFQEKKSTRKSGSEPQTSRQAYRIGVSEKQLQDHLYNDLTALLNTTRLDAAVSLRDVPHVAKSILNYGFRDLSSIGAAELNTPAIVESIRQSLIDHEPRLLHDTIQVTVRESGYNASQKLSISVTAELIGDPVDIPLDFDAEVDLGAGKLKMSKLRVQT